LFILAYPEEEWRRLEKVVTAMPIDADGDLVDGKPERLPKQIVSSLELTPSNLAPSLPFLMKRPLILLPIVKTSPARETRCNLSKAA